MHPALLFKHCPSCGAAREAARAQPLKCSGCGFTLFINTTCATGAFLRRADGRVLFIRRAHEPAKGRLAIPGGFIDEGETAEAALRREFLEEVGVPLGELTFLCSHPNAYLYAGVTYPVLDFFFAATAAGDETPQALDAVESFCWLDPASVREEDIAFPSMVHALRVFLVHTAGLP
jgi:ADP-ribose pyrophosphatase YjhB (NUDIX family)